MLFASTFTPVMFYTQLSSQERSTMISVQPQDFDFSKEYDDLRKNSPQSGAIVMFTGLVRDFSEDQTIKKMTLEHYPGMTENTLQGIADQAKERWPLEAVRIIHRVGDLYAQDQIVLVGVSSAHRAAAYEASQFIMDILKTEAPFWKKETTIAADGEEDQRWVDAKQSDQDKAHSGEK